MHFLLQVRLLGCQGGGRVGACCAFQKGERLRGDAGVSQHALPEPLASLDSTLRLRLRHALFPLWQAVQHFSYCRAVGLRTRRIVVHKNNAII